MRGRKETYMGEQSVAPPKSLVTKLAEACNAVGGVEKKGRNENQKYNYVKAADVAKAIRHELFQRSIILIADEKEVTQSEVKTASGGTMRYLQLKVEYTLHDGESAEKLTSTAYGIAMDSGDKAIFKAKTGALKYFLRGLGLIPDEKDDPEADESVDEQTRIYEENFEKRSAKQKLVADYQVRAFDAACHRSGKTAEQVSQFLKTAYKVASVSELMRQDFNQAIKWGSGTAELADVLKTSLTSVTNIRAGKKPQPAVTLAEANRERTPVREPWTGHRK